MTQTTRYIAETEISRLKKIGYFSNCGKCDKVPFGKTTSITTANKICKSISYGNYLLDRQNEITEYLCKHHRSEYKDWNNRVLYFKSALAEIFLRSQNELLKIGMIKDVSDCVEWDILSHCMYLAYRDCNIPRYYNDIWPIYESGHIICGYKGDYPNGQLLIF